MFLSSFVPTIRISNEILHKKLIAFVNSSYLSRKARFTRVLLVLPRCRINIGPTKARSLYNQFMYSLNSNAKKGKRS